MIKVSYQVSNLVSIKSGQAVTTSLQVAEAFSKDHKNVLRDINNLVEGGQLNFEQTHKMFSESTYVNEQNGQSYPMYYMNRDGFSLLAMGFTGQKALKFKLAYIKQFNQMEQALRNSYQVDTDTAMHAIRLPNGDIQLVVHFQEQPVRVISAFVDGTRLIVAKDLNLALGYGNWHQATHDYVVVPHRRHYQVASINAKPARGGLQVATVLDEVGLAQLLAHSKKPAASLLAAFIKTEAFPKLEALSNSIPSRFATTDAVTGQLELPLDNQPAALLKLAGIAKEQGQTAIYEDLLSRAIGVVQEPADTPYLTN
ncbi:Rha family transcriptional regulator [Lacticaseibacillus chiayiensis]|nr:Rha family transcriptional regulator [Lacticaseibacillus chiayiensis]